MELKHWTPATAIALVCAALAAGPGLAQVSPYSTNSTPEERAQTRSLNQGEAQNEGMTPSGQTGVSADRQYNAQQQHYQEQLQNYRHQRAAYEARLGQYEYDRSHPREWWNSRYEHATFDGVYRLPRMDLIGREVDERDGLQLGRIADVERASDGRVVRIEIAFSGNRTAWVGADHLRYDWDDHIMFTDVPAGELYDRAREASYNPRP